MAGLLSIHNTWPHGGRGGFYSVSFPPEWWRVNPKTQECHQREIFYLHFTTQSCGSLDGLLAWVGRKGVKSCTQVWSSIWERWESVPSHSSFLITELSDPSIVATWCNACITHEVAMVDTDQGLFNNPRFYSGWLPPHPWWYGVVLESWCMVPCILHVIHIKSRPRRPSWLSSLGGNYMISQSIQLVICFGLLQVIITKLQGEEPWQPETMSPQTNLPHSFDQVISPNQGENGFCLVSNWMGRCPEPEWPHNGQDLPNGIWTTGLTVTLKLWFALAAMIHVIVQGEERRGNFWMGRCYNRKDASYWSTLIIVIYCLTQALLHYRPGAIF